jgi:hypothetical protein
VEVTQLIEDAQELGVELRVAHLRLPEPQQAQPLARVDRVHGVLVQQVHVQAVQQDRCLLREGLAIGPAQQVLLDEGAKLWHRTDVAEVVPRLQSDLRDR